MTMHQTHIGPKKKQLKHKLIRASPMEGPYLTSTTPC